MMDSSTPITSSSGRSSQNQDVTSLPTSHPSVPSSEASSAKLTQLLHNDPARTGFDPASSKWANYFRALTGRMTDEGQFHFREHESRVNEASDVRECERMRDRLFTVSPTIVFLRDKIEALNGRLDASNVHCVRCPARLTEAGSIVRRGGGFSPHYGIQICANAMRDQSHLEDTIAHEMIHAYDLLRWKVDFVGEHDLRQAACTEIRASMLSGECRWSRNFFTYKNWNLTREFQKCVRWRAVMSMMSRAAVRDDLHAVKIVNEVWDSCFSDTRPFDDIYR